ncbi:MAG: hypothetical protein LBQ56_07745, partial [Synergistaceae bacterium]|nr:hypothetical protein [Synergistaceae bacterium]
DTGDWDDNSITLPALREATAPAGTLSDSITLLKQGKGRLILKGISNHTGDTIIEEGTLELGEVPSRSHVIEIRSGASLQPSMTSLITITLKPESGAAIILPSSRNIIAAPNAGTTGGEILKVGGIDRSDVDYDPVKIDADLSSVKMPDGAEADEYLVKLVNSTSAHGLDADDVEITGASPTNFGSSYYSIRPRVDEYNIYAVLSRDVTVTETIKLSFARDESSVSVRATLSDGASGKAVSFTLSDASGSRLDSASETSLAGEAQHTFANLTLGATYRITVSSPNYNSAVGEVTIDGKVVDDDGVTDGSLTVTISDEYDESFRPTQTAVRIKGENPLPTDGTLRYRFVNVGGIPTGEVENPVTDDTWFTATGVTYNSADPTTAIFYINRNNLTADGKKYNLVPGVAYRLVVESLPSGSDGGSTDRSDGSSEDYYIRDDGVYLPTDGLMLVTYASVVSGDSIRVSALARQNGAPKPDVLVKFTLLDIYGYPVEVSNTKEQATGPDGIATEVFERVPTSRSYVVRAASPGDQFIGYSREISFATGGGGGGGGGGCNAGPAALALPLAAAVALVRRRKTG